MEPTDKPFINTGGHKDEGRSDLAIEFLPDADEIERGPLPKGTRFVLHALAAALVIFLVWAAFSSVDQVVVAKGRLINPTPNIIVQPFDTAIIRTINVKVGQVVKKGELLATLDPTFSKADESELRQRLKSLDTQAQALEAELEGRPLTIPGVDPDVSLQAKLSTERKANYAAQMQKLNEIVAKLRAQMITNKGEQASLSQRVKSLREIESMQERLLAQNYGARIHLLEAQEKRLEVERDQQQTLLKEQELKRDLAAAQAEMDAFDKGWRQKAMEDLLGATRERDSVSEQLAKADKRYSLVNLTAPEDGVVLEIAKLAPGSIVREAETFFTLVPLNAKMEAEVEIDSMDIGYIKTNADVHMKLDAFPFQKHGALEGKVRTISQDAFRRETGGSQAAAYYLSRINYGNSQLKKMDNARLLPGMTLSAEIVVGQRSVLSYLMWPLTKAMDEAIREP